MSSMNSSTSQNEFSERTCSILTTLSQTTGTMTLVVDEKTSSSSLPEGVTRQGKQLLVDLTRFPTLADPSHSLWIADAEVIIVHQSGEVEYRAFSSDCPHHQSDESIFESDAPAPPHDQCPSFRSTVGGDGAPAEETESDLRPLPVAKKGDTLRIALDSQNVRR